MEGFKKKSSIYAVGNGFAKFHLWLFIIEWLRAVQSASVRGKGATRADFQNKLEFN
jgi:hypothetical protein